MAQHGHKRGTYLVAEKQHIVLEMKVSYENEESST
jgi:hypothetical protein